MTSFWFLKSRLTKLSWCRHGEASYWGSNSFWLWQCISSWMIGNFGKWNRLIHLCSDCFPTMVHCKIHISKFVFWVQLHGRISMIMKHFLNEFKFSNWSLKKPHELEMKFHHIQLYANCIWLRRIEYSKLKEHRTLSTPLTSIENNKKKLLCGQIN